MSKIFTNSAVDQRLRRFVFFVFTLPHGFVHMYCNSIKYTFVSSQ